MKREFFLGLEALASGEAIDGAKRFAGGALSRRAIRLTWRA
ncbi:MAG: hypothetical protein ACREJ3_18380 [Polyangiaceae bacterium]